MPLGPGIKPRTCCYRSSQLWPPIAFHSQSSVFGLACKSLAHLVSLWVWKLGIKTSHVHVTLKLRAVVKRFHSCIWKVHFVETSFGILVATLPMFTQQWHGISSMQPKTSLWHPRFKWNSDPNRGSSRAHRIPIRAKWTSEIKNGTMVLQVCKLTDLENHGPSAGATALQDSTTQQRLVFGCKHHLLVDVCSWGITRSLQQCNYKWEQV